MCMVSNTRMEVERVEGELIVDFSWNGGRHEIYIYISICIGSDSFNFDMFSNGCDCWEKHCICLNFIILLA